MAPRDKESFYMRSSVRGEKKKKETTTKRKRIKFLQREIIDAHMKSFCRQLATSVVNIRTADVQFFLNYCLCITCN